MKKRTSTTQAKQEFLTFYAGKIKQVIISIVPEHMQLQVTDEFATSLTTCAKELYSQLCSLTEVPSEDRSRYAPFKFARTESFVLGVCAAYVCNNIYMHNGKLTPEKIDFRMIARDARALLISKSTKDALTLTHLESAYKVVFLGDVADMAVHSATGRLQDVFASSQGLTPGESEVDGPRFSLGGLTFTDEDA